MTNLIFEKNYKNNDNLRLSFNTLANNTLGVSFEEWYQKGFWNENYIPYSYCADDQIVSNVSISLMKLMIEGEAKPGIQVGTVMTHPDFRRKGLAYSLFQKVFDDYPPDKYLYFLSADDMAVGLYEKCGFKKWQDYSFSLPLNLDTAKQLKPSFSKCNLTKDQWKEMKKSSLPLSHKLSAIDDQHVLMFYYCLGFSDKLYILDKDVYALITTDASTLNLFAVFSQREYDLSDLIATAKKDGFAQINFFFTPDQEIKALQSKPTPSSDWMVHPGTGRSFPTKARFPKVSQT